MKRRKMKLYQYLVLVLAVCFVLAGLMPMPARAEEEMWIVNFNPEGGNCDVSEIRVPKGESVILPEITYEGYRFGGWIYAYEEEPGRDVFRNVGYAGVTFTPTEYFSDIHASWYKEFTIAFDACGGECAQGSMVVIKTDSVTLPEASREGFEFTGWYGDEGLTEYVGAAGDTFSTEEDRTLYAGWKESEKEKQKFIIIFNVPEGECDPKSVEVEEGESVTLPEATREGYEFTGWYSDEELTDYIGGAGETWTPDGGKTLYAGWKETEKEKKKFTIIFNVPEGECNPRSVEVEEGESITLPEAAREGYEFTGWYSDEELTDYIGGAGETWTPDEGKTLYAGWKVKENTGGDEKEPDTGKEDENKGQDKAQKVTVSFETGGGSEVAPIQVVKGNAVKLPAAEKEGYTFLGWYTEKDGGILLGLAGDSLKASEDMTLYALWEKKEEPSGEDKDDEGNGKQEEGKETCSAVFRTGRGSLTATEVTVAKGASLYLPIPVCDGYEFVGWYLDEALTQFAGGGGKAYRITEDVCFYAKWKEAAENGKVDDSSGENTEKGDVGKGDNGKQEGNDEAASTKKQEESGAAAGKADAEAVAGSGNTNSTGAGVSPAGNTGSSLEENKEIADTGKAVEPVIQTGHTSPVPVFYGLGLCGLFLVLSAFVSGKKGRHGRG